MKRQRRVKKFSKTIYVRGIKWTIKTKFCLRDENGTPCLGLCDDNKKQILLEEDQTWEEFIETLIHEYLHAVWYGTGLDDEGVPSWVEHMFVNQVSKDMIINASFFASLFRTL